MSNYAMDSISYSNLSSTSLQSLSQVQAHALVPTLAQMMETDKILMNNLKCVKHIEHNKKFRYVTNIDKISRCMCTKNAFPTNLSRAQKYFFLDIRGK